MEDYYAAYSRKGDMELIVQDIIRTYEKNRGQDFQADFIRDREQALDSVLFRLVNTERNRLHLGGVPHADLDWMGLSMVFYLMIQAEEGRCATVLVDNRLMQEWDSSDGEIMEHAQRNTPEKMRISMCRMAELLCLDAYTMQSREWCRASSVCADQ